MGRLIPAGTGMKSYRNIVIDHDPTMNQKKTDEYDEYTDIRGGLDLPESMDVPFVETDADLDGFSLEDAEGDPILDDTEEVFEVEGSLGDFVDDEDDDF
jgi:hypothetical protein